VNIKGTPVFGCEQRVCKCKIVRINKKMADSEQNERKLSVIHSQLGGYLRDDVVIGVVALKAAGGSTSAAKLKTMLENMGFEVHIHKVSNFLREQVKDNDANRQDTGNRLREENGPDILARWVTKEIHTLSEDRDKKRAHIIDSLKHPMEVSALRAVYGANFWLLAVFAARGVREERLKTNSLKKRSKDEIRELLDRDEHEKNNNGQRVSDTSVEADYFIRNNQNGINTYLEEKLKRFLDIAFARIFVSPTLEETGMFQAASVARASMCLSRPVGAAVISKNGDVLGLGCNDVPVAGGGLYTDSSPHDERCYKRGNSGICFNDQEKDSKASKIAENLLELGLISEEKKSDAFKAIRYGELKSILEFSRSIHAEMAAILAVARKGSSELVGADLFVTTYPCHNCARHIIAAGIDTVYFVEPFRKSLAIELHSDAIESEVDPRTPEQAPNKASRYMVKFVQYEGIGTHRFYSVYQKIRPNKDKGNVPQFEPDTPALSAYDISAKDREKIVASKFPL